MKELIRELEEARQNLERAESGLRSMQMTPKIPASCLQSAYRSINTWRTKAESLADQIRAMAVAA